MDLDAELVEDEKSIKTIGVEIGRKKNVANSETSINF